MCVDVCMCVRVRVMHVRLWSVCGWVHESVTRQQGSVFWGVSECVKGSVCKGWFMSRARVILCTWVSRRVWCVLIQHMASVSGNMVRHGVKGCHSNRNPNISNISQNSEMCLKKVPSISFIVVNWLQMCRSLDMTCMMSWWFTPYSIKVIISICRLTDFFLLLNAYILFHSCFLYFGLVVPLLPRWTGFELKRHPLCCITRPFICISISQ